jgi:hypothetical protein
MPIQYVVTKNPALLAQYYELRNRIYRRHYPHLPEDFGHEEATDHVSDIVVAYDGCVVAGGRITVSRRTRPQPMPMEEAGFRLIEAVPQFELDTEPYAEFSRLAVDPSYAHGRRCSFGLIAELAHTVANQGVDLVFSICPAAMVRHNSANARWCGVGFQTFPEIDIPTSFRIHMTLCAYTGLVSSQNQRLSA